MTDDVPDPTRSAMAADPLPAIVPSRFRRALVHTVDNAVPADAAGEIGRWLHEHRDALVRVGDAEGQQTFAFAHPNIEQDAPAALLAPVRCAISSACGPEGLAAVEVPAFDVRGVQLGAALYHHGGHDSWHDDVLDSTGAVAATRRIAFAVYLHSTPKMFAGGELEFTDGTIVEPRHCRLALWHPAQSCRVRRVECWSAHVLHGLWALFGWMHGEPPEGWLERLEQLRRR